MNTQEKINRSLQSAEEVSETFNGVTTIQKSVLISVSEALEFSQYLSERAQYKGRNSGTMNDKTVQIISDWYDVGNVSYMINHCYGKARTSKINYYNLVKAFEL